MPRDAVIIGGFTARRSRVLLSLGEEDEGDDAQDAKVAMRLDACCFSRVERIVRVALPQAGLLRRSRIATYAHSDQSASLLHFAASEPRRRHWSSRKNRLAASALHSMPPTRRSGR
jgi:hypothetical protein